MSIYDDIAAAIVDGQPISKASLREVMKDIADLGGGSAIEDGDFSSDGLMARTGAGAYASRTIAGTSGQFTITNGDGVSGNPTIALASDVLFPGIGTFPNTGLHILDTDGSHDLIIQNNENQTADRTLQIELQNANRRLVITGTAVINQDYRETASPQFTALNIGHASDTTLARVSAGDLSIEGNIIYRAGGTDVPVADGGTGASDASGARTNLGLVIGTHVQAYHLNLDTLSALTLGAVGTSLLTVADPGADRFLMWDDSAGAAKAAALADILTEAAPAAGDFLLMMGAEGDVRKVDWDDLPSGGGGGAVDSVNGQTGTVVLDADDIDDTATTNKFTTSSDISKLAGIESGADVTDAGNVGSSIDGATAKATPVDADTVPLIDSAASNVLKKLTWANVKATLKTYFDTLYLTAAGSATLTSKTIDAASNTISNLATSMFAANVIDTDTSLTANSNTRIASQAAVKAYVDANGGGSGLIVGGNAVVTASGSESTGGSGNYNFNSSPTTAPTTSQAHRKDDATLAYTAQSASNKLRFNYAGSGSYTFTQINGSHRVHVVAALYRDSEANAIAWAVAYSTTITGTGTGNQLGRCGFNLTFLVDPPDTSAHTYHVRFVNTTAPTGQGTMSAIVGRIFSVEELAI